MADASSVYGFDVDLSDDMDASGRSASGARLVANALRHRLTTDSLLLVDSDSGFADYGEDVRRWLGEGLTAEQVSARGPRVVEIVQRDERVESADADVSMTPNDGLYDMRIDITASLLTGETIRLVLGISAVTVELLSEGT